MSHQKKPAICEPEAYTSEEGWYHLPGPVPVDGEFVLVALRMPGRTIEPIIPDRSEVSIGYRRNGIWTGQSNNQQIPEPFAWRALPVAPPLPKAHRLPWPWGGPPTTVGEKLVVKYVPADGRGSELAKAIDEAIHEATQ